MPRPKIGRLEDPALTHLLNKALIKDLSSSKSLLFIKCVAPQLSSKVLAESGYLKKSSVV
jgi:hypothetical protein